ncbi:MAG: response regulator, partial [Myxococcota bacterium]
MLDPTSTSQTHRIVVIDDSPTVLRVMESILTQHGYAAYCTDDGAQAVELVREVTPDLIFVDFAMPRVNGFEVCQRLGEHPDLEAIPIVIMSTKGDPIGDRFVREMGIVDHITKPFAPEALVALVEHCLHRARHPRPQLKDTDSALAEHSLAEHFATLTGLSAEELASALKTALGQTDWVEEARRLLQRAEGAPALAGDIAQCGLSEVLQTLGMQRQSGRFTVRSRNTEIGAWFLEGSVRLVTGVGIPEEHRLGAILVRRGDVEAEQIQRALARNEGRRLGAIALDE